MGNYAKVILLVFRQNVYGAFPCVTTGVGLCRRRSLQSEAVVYLENSLTWNHLILHEPSYWPDLQLHRIWYHTVLLVGSYRRSKNGRK